MEVEADFAKWPRAEVERYILKPGLVLLLEKHTFWRPGGAVGHRGGGDMATGLCSKCVTVDKSSSQGDDRRERPRAAEVEVKIAKWPRTVVKRYILKPSVVLLW